MGLCILLYAGLVLSVGLLTCALLTSIHTPSGSTTHRLSRHYDDFHRALTAASAEYLQRVSQTILNERRK
jgi:hypothetical protein